MPATGLRRLRATIVLAAVFTVACAALLAAIAVVIRLAEGRPLSSRAITMHLTLGALFGVTVGLFTAGYLIALRPRTGGLLSPQHRMQLAFTMPWFLVLGIITIPLMLFVQHRAAAAVVFCGGTGLAWLGSGLASRRILARPRSVEPSQVPPERSKPLSRR